jgi:hypothetical protein
VEQRFRVPVGDVGGRAGFVQVALAGFDFQGQRLGAGRVDDDQRVQDRPHGQVELGAVWAVFHLRDLDRQGHAVAFDGVDEVGVVFDGGEAAGVFVAFLGVGDDWDGCVGCAAQLVDVVDDDAHVRTVAVGAAGDAAQRVKDDQAVPFVFGAGE